MWSIQGQKKIKMFCEESNDIENMKTSGLSFSNKAISQFQQWLFGHRIASISDSLTVCIAGISRASNCVFPLTNCCLWCFSCCPLLPTHPPTSPPPSPWLLRERQRASMPPPAQRGSALCTTLPEPASLCFHWDDTSTRLLTQVISNGMCRWGPKPS